MIEKKIHYVWLGTKKLPTKFSNFINEWQALHPDWEIIKWNEDNFDCQSNEWTRQALAQNNYSLAADVIRSVVLYNYGGVYLDTDVKLFKPLDELVENNDFFIGYESNYWFGCAVLGSAKGHQIMKEVCERYYNMPHTNLDHTSNMLCVLNFSSAIKRLYGVKLDGKTRKVNNTLMLASDYFYPQNYITRKIKITKNTIGIHNYSSTWHSPGMFMGLKIAQVFRFILGKKGFGVFEKIARLNMLIRLKREYKRRQLNQETEGKVYVKE